MTQKVRMRSLRKLRDLRREVEEWRSLVGSLKPDDPRFEGSLRAFEYAMEQRNRLERKLREAAA